MCLCINNIKTQKHSKIKTNKIYTFYKEFELFNGKIYTPYQYCNINKTVDFINAKGYLNINLLDKQINGGCIHSYITKTESSFYDSIIVPIKVESNDIIAFGENNDVCFFRYKIPETS
jgi:hypothetical protein